MNVPVVLYIPGSDRRIDGEALLDSGSTGSCIHRDYVRRHGLEMRAFDVPIDVYNADGSVNSGGRITHFVQLLVQIGDHRERMTFLVTDLGKSDLFLGYEWISHHNPRIDWRERTIEFSRCPETCERVLGEGERLFALHTRSYLSSRRHHAQRVELRANAMDIAIEQSRGRAARSFEETVPGPYRDFADVFSEEAFA